MRIAIVHDYIKEYGGAERVLEQLVSVFPKACVYTSLYKSEYLGPHRKRFEKMDIQESFFKYIPFSHRLISPLRLLSPLAFWMFDLKKYDVVIVSQTGAYFPNFVRTDETTVHYCYTHTPPRYLYGYRTAREWRKNALLNVVAGIVNHFLRMVDYRASQNVDYFIANSEEVRARIQKFYRRDAAVVYPPVKLATGKRVKEEGTSSYYLAGGRLARAKGINVIVKAFLKNGKNLKIFGKGFAGYEDELRLIASGADNIEFVGEVTDAEKLNLMRNAKAYVFSSYDEDFGITPVEAMSVGTAVVSYRSGGVQETVVEGKTGVFYGQNTAEELTKAIRRFEKVKIHSKDCIERAKLFSCETFERKIRSIIRKTKS